MHPSGAAWILAAQALIVLSISLFVVVAVRQGRQIAWPAIAFVTIGAVVILQMILEKEVLGVLWSNLPFLIVVLLGSAAIVLANRFSSVLSNMVIVFESVAWVASILGILLLKLPLNSLRLGIPLAVSLGMTSRVGNKKGKHRKQQQVER